MDLEIVTNDYSIVLPTPIRIGRDVVAGRSARPLPGGLPLKRRHEVVVYAALDERGGSVLEIRDPVVSRSHGALRIVPTGIELLLDPRTSGVDLFSEGRWSSHGVRDSAPHAVIIRPGQRIRLGDVEFIVRLASEAGAALPSGRSIPLSLGVSDVLALLHIDERGDLSIRTPATDAPPSRDPWSEHAGAEPTPTIQGRR